MKETDLQITPTEPEDWEILKPKLRKYDRLEMLATGCDKLTPEEYVDLHAELYTARYKDEIHATFGVTPAIGIMYFSFVGTDEIYNHTKYYTIKAKAFINNRAKEYYWLTPTVIIHPENKGSKVWIERFLGFENTGWKHKGLEIYQRRNHNV